MKALPNKVCEKDKQKSFDGIIAVMILPGILQIVNEYKRRGVTAIGLLKAIGAANNKAVNIIEQAIALQAIRKARKEHVDTKPNVERLRTEAEKLNRYSGTSAAGRKLKENSNIIRDIVPAEKSSKEQMDTKIDALFPVADKQDILPDKEFDPAEIECLQIDAHIIRNRSQNINKDVSAGTAAWTPILLSTILNQENSPEYNAKMPPHAVHEAMAKFSNKRLRGDISDRMRRVIFEIRLVLIDKVEELEARPLQIDCLFMRFMVGMMTKNM